MAEVQTMRLAKAAATYNVSVEHVLEKLKESGFELENKPTSKLTGEMVVTLDKAFRNRQGHQAKQADSTNIDKTKKDTVEMNPPDTIAAPRKKEEEKEITVKSNLLKEEDEVITAKKQKLEGTKEVGRLDLEEQSKKGKKKKEEEVVEEAPVVVEEKPKKKEEPAPEPVQKIETKYQTLEGTKEVGRIDSLPSLRRSQKRRKRRRKK